MDRVYVIRDGNLDGAKMFDCRMDGDVPTVRVGDNYFAPLANGYIVERLGLGKLTPQMIIQRPEIWLHLGINEGGREVITQAEMTKRSKIAQEQRAAALIAACPGLDVLRAAYNDVSRYHDQMERMMEDESNDGARPPKPIKGDVDALRVQYPAAAAYLRAESWSCASHDVKSTAGIRAMERIVAGEDHAQVMADMEREWTDHCNAHIWD